MKNNDSLIGLNPSVIAPFVIDLFKAYVATGIIWAVMRGWERLPFWTRYDIDILVAEGDAVRAVMLTKKVAERNGWKVYGVLMLGMMFSVWMLRNNKDGQCYLRIDIETGNAYRGIEIHESQRYLENRICENINGVDIWHMPVGYAAACVLLKELAVKGSVESEKRRGQVLEGVSDNQFAQIVQDAIADAELADKVVNAAKVADWNKLASCAGRVKKRLFRKSPVHILKMTGYVFSLLRQMLFPYMRCLIVLVGPDGCGKTTIADAICDRFKGRPFQSIMRVHMLFGVPRMRDIIGIAYRLVGRKQPPQKIVPPGTRHCGMQKPHSMLKAMMYVTYYGIGMLLGRLKLILWRTQGGLVVADRFYQDYYYMRGYMNCPKWYIRIMEVFSPRPDLILSLERPAEDIYAQKPELDVGEIMREQAVIRKYIGGRRNARIIDASQGLEKTICSVIQEIEGHIATRREF